VSSNTFYKWKAKYGGMGGSEVRRMKELEAKISRLECIVAKRAVEFQAA
jgi:putative transposase